MIRSCKTIFRGIAAVEVSGSVTILGGAAAEDGPISVDGIYVQMH